jgi:isoamylase
LRRTRFYTGANNEELGVKDVTWINTDGKEMQQANWEDTNMKCFGMMMDGRAQVTGIRKRGQDATLLLVMNAWHDGVAFTLPEAPEGRGWRRLVDTNLPDTEEEARFDIGATYEATGRSVLLFLLEAK